MELRALEGCTDPAHRAAKALELELGQRSRASQLCGKVSRSSLEGLGETVPFRFSRYKVVELRLWLPAGKAPLGRG